MKSRATIMHAIEDQALFAPWFKDRASWAAWFVFLRALFGLPMSPEDLSLFRACTGRQDPPEGRVRECFLACGRRAGKSFILALVAVYLACFVVWTKYLSPGERGCILVLAADRRQARTIYRYAHALLTGVPMLKALITRATADAIDLSNGVTIEISAASYRTVRGYTVIAALCDEIAFWHSDESSNPDSEILAALRPAMATVPGAMLLCASSPHARKGVLWKAYDRYFGKDHGPLVWQAATRVMNPSVPQSFIDAAYEDDASSASSEYGADFRRDLETFVSPEAVGGCVLPGRRELPRLSGVQYRAAVDPSGGSSDSMTLAIGHLVDGNRVVIDCVRERRPPFSPSDVVLEFASVLKGYGITEVHGDRYAGEWSREPFRLRGIGYELNELTASDLYRDLLPLLNSGRIELLDIPRLTTQLCNLERTVARSGKDTISHPRGAHDDIANVVASVASVLLAKGAPIDWGEGLRQVQAYVLGRAGIGVVMPPAAAPAPQQKSIIAENFGARSSSWNRGSQPR